MTQVLPETQVVRPMGSADLDAVWTLEKTSQPAPWSRTQFAAELANPVSTIDLCEWDGAVAGYLCAWTVAGELQIHNVVTAPAHRRRGVAARLLESVLARARQQGCQYAWLEVRVGNRAAIALYERFGFEITGHRKGYYADGEDALIMTASITA